MAVLISKIELSPSTVETDGEVNIAVSVSETVEEPEMYRLSYKFGTAAGALNTDSAD